MRRDFLEVQVPASCSGNSESILGGNCGTTLQFPQFRCLTKKERRDCELIYVIDRQLNVVLGAVGGLGG